MKKRILALVVLSVLMLSLGTQVFAATGNTVTFNGGHIYEEEVGKPGTATLTVTNIIETRTVKFDEKELMTYVDSEEVANRELYTDADGVVTTIKDVVTNENGITVYYANNAPVTVTATSALTTFFYSYKGDEIKSVYTPKFYTYDEYYNNFENTKIYTKKPEVNWLFAPGTTSRLDKPGKYLFIVKDDGLIGGSDTPSNAFCVIVGATPAPKAPAFSATPTASKILVNGTSTAFEAYNINGSNYFKLRDLAKAVSGSEKEFEVTWDGTKNAINLVSGNAYTSVGGELVNGDGLAKQTALSTAIVYKDGEKQTLTAYTINGNNYFKLRDVAKSFDIGITWDNATSTVGIDTTISYQE
jgi:hypothetical protein